MTPRRFHSLNMISQPLLSHGLKSAMIHMSYLIGLAHTHMRFYFLVVAFLWCFQIAHPYNAIHKTRHTRKKKKRFFLWQAKGCFLIKKKEKKALLEYIHFVSVPCHHSLQWIWVY